MLGALPAPLQLLLDQRRVGLVLFDESKIGQSMRLGSGVFALPKELSRIL